MFHERVPTLTLIEHAIIGSASPLLRKDREGGFVVPARCPDYTELGQP